MFTFTDNLPSLSRSNLTGFSPLNFVTSADLTSNFKLEAKPDISNNFKGVGGYYFDALIGSNFRIILLGSYGTPMLEIYNENGTGLTASIAADSDASKFAVINFVAPSTGRYYLASVVDSSDHKGFLIVSEDESTSPAYTPPTPTPTPTPTVPTPLPPVKPVTTVSNTPNNNIGQKLVGTYKSENLVGSDGNDTIIGGLGFDTLTGGKGADKFVFNSIKDAPIAHSKIETITDFSHDDGDKIDLSGIDANTSIAKDQAFSAPVIGSEFSGTFTKAGQLFFDTTDQILYGCVNNDGVASFAIQLSGVTNLVASDFIL